jgi:hypothetical protein
VHIEAMLPDWTLAPVVAALQTMRGMALVNAATLIAELGDLSRFTNPRQLMTYLGLVPLRLLAFPMRTNRGMPAHRANADGGQNRTKLTILLDKGRPCDRGRLILWRG